MACVGRLVSEAAAGEYGAYGLALVYERVAVLFINGILCRRGLRFQKLTVFKIVCVLHISCGMKFRNIQRFEAFVVGNDLAVILNGKSHGAEHVFALALHKRYGMIRTVAGFNGNGHIKLGGEFNNLFELRLLKLRRFLGNTLCRKAFQFVYRLTEAFSVLSRKAAHFLQKNGYFAAFSEK